MELNFSNKNLVSFDASYLGKGVEKSINASLLSSGGGSGSGESSSLANLLECAPVVKGIDLSHNAIHMFVGGETLRHVVRLDLSYNVLSVLNTNSLPPALQRLNLAHNNLRELGSLAIHVPLLQELDISYNDFTASGLRDFPPSLTVLHAQGNNVGSLEALQPLKRLSRLNVSGNRLDTVEALQGLRDLPCLHHLELRDNGVLAAAATAFGVSESVAVRRVLADVAPRLVTLDGQPLSQASSNNNFKAMQLAASRASSRTSARSQSNSSSIISQPTRQPVSHSRVNTEPVQTPIPNRLTRPSTEMSCVSQQTTGTSKRLRTTRAPAPPAMEVRLMEAKVAELRRLLAESEKRENEERYERNILMDQIKSCAGVIDAQAVELGALQQEIVELEEEDRSLRDRVAAVEHTFEQTHATLIAQRVELFGHTEPAPK